MRVTYKLLHESVIGTGLSVRPGLSYYAVVDVNGRIICDGSIRECLRYVNGWKDARDTILVRESSAYAALAALYALHEPEGRFQPSHYKPILSKVRDALGLTRDQAARAYNATDSAVRLSSQVLEWARTPQNHGGNPYSQEFVKTAQRISGEA